MWASAREVAYVNQKGYDVLAKALYDSSQSLDSNSMAGRYSILF